MERRSKQLKADTAADRPVVIASRRACEADGTGLSHYILMDKPTVRQ